MPHSSTANAEHGGPAAAVPHGPHDYCPWRFWRVATADEQAAQLEFQARLCSAGRIALGVRCYVSPVAGIVVDRLALGDGSYIAAYAYVTGDIEAGSNCTLNPYAVVRGRVRLGNGVRIGAHACLLGFEHRHGDPRVPMWQQGLTSAGITLGDDVWVGSGVIVRDGVSVGSHAILAAGAVVTRDVPEYAIVAGNPARRIRDRRSPQVSTGDDPERRLRAFGDGAARQWPAVLARAATMTAGGPCFADPPASVPLGMRPCCDAIEIAAMFGGVPAGRPREGWIEFLNSVQDPVTGLLSDPFRGPQALPAESLADPALRYLLIAIPNALVCLGGQLRAPLHAVADLTGARLETVLAGLPWQHNAWSAGGFVDAIATAMAFNRRWFDLAGERERLLCWLRRRCLPHTGLWGAASREQGWLQPVNGFYRITRGTFGAWDLPVPHPETVIDIVLAHLRQHDGFAEREAPACNVLDCLHALWLCGRQTAHRGDEVAKAARGQIALIARRWVDGQGFGFTAGETPGLRGTEMWLAALYTAAAILGLTAALSCSPRGVHALTTHR